MRQQADEERIFAPLPLSSLRMMGSNYIRKGTGNRAF